MILSLHSKWLGKKIEAMTDSIFFGSKIIVDSDCSHEIKRSSLLERKAMISLDSVLKSKDELKSLLLKVKEECEKAGLKFNIQKSKIMASSPLATSWQTGKKKIKTVTDFIFLSSKITADGDCSHEIERKEGKLTNLDSILQNKDIICQ